MATKKQQPAYLSNPSGFDFDAGERFISSLQQSTPPEPEKPSVARRIGDTAVQFGQGAVTGVKMMSDIFGANNAVSSGLSDVNQALDGLLSATAQNDKQKVAQIMQEAEGKGWGEQIVAGLKAAGVDPVGLAANALGTSLPTMATMLIPGAGPAAVAARMGAGVAMGAGQGVGAVKGQIYDETKRKWQESGATPEQAEAKAQEAAAYGGENTDQIAIGGVLGMGSVLGAERALGKVLHGASKAGPGMLGRVATSTLAETGTEMLQGGQEKFASNTALNRQGFDVDPMSGVIANATLEGAAAAPMGAVAGIPKPAVAAAPEIDPAKEAADTIRNTEKVPESGALTKAVNAGVEAKALAVESGAPLVDEQAMAEPEPVDDPVRDQILALPEGARQDALRAYAVVNRTDVAKGVQQYNRKLLDRLLAENAPPPVLGERLTDTDMGSMLGGGGMAGRADPLAGALGMNNEAQAAAITNVANVAERRPPMPASDAARMLDEARNRGLDLAVAEHPAGGFVLVPPNWVTPDMAAQGEARLNETIARMQQADAAPVERAPRTSTAPVDLNLPTDPVQNYVGNLRTVNTPAARAYVRDFDAGRITPADVQQRMQAEQGLTPEQRIARAAAEAPAKTDPVADRLARAAAQGIATPAPTDILNPAGEPFKTRMAADRAAKKTPGAVVPVEGGFVVRPQEPVNVQDVPQAPEVPQAAPAISQPSQAQEAVGTQPAGPAAGVPAEGAGAVEAAGVAPAGNAGNATGVAGAPTIVEVQDNYGRTHRVRQSDLYSNADRIPTVRQNGDVVAGEEIPRSIVKDAPTVAEPPPLDPLGWNAKKLASTYDMAQLQDLYQYVRRNYSNPVVGGAPVENGKATTDRFNAEGRKIHTALQQAQTVLYEQAKVKRAQDAPTIPLAQQGAFDGGQRLEADAGDDATAAGAVPTPGDPVAGEPAATGAGGEMLDALDGRPGATGAPAGDVAGPTAPAVGAPLDALQNQAVAPELQAQAATKGVANQPITRAQVDSAVQQASSAVGARIDAMSAQEVQKIAARFLPTMGVRVPAGKARIKEAVTSAGPRMNWAAAAAEFGAELSQDAMSALQADVEGRVQEEAGPEMPTAGLKSDGATAGNADGTYAPESSGMRSREGADGGSVPLAAPAPQPAAPKLTPAEAKAQPASKTAAQEVGPFGPIFTGLGNQPEAAIEKLMQEQRGEVADAFTHPELGPIAFVYGDKDMGLRHIEAKRGIQWVRRIPDILRNGRLERDPKLPRAYLVQDGDPSGVAVIRLDWDGEQKTWLVTAHPDDKGKWSGVGKTSRTADNESGLVQGSPSQSSPQTDFATTGQAEQPDTPKLTQAQRGTLDASLLAGAMSVDDYMKATGLTDEDVGTFRPDGLRSKAEQKARAANPYYQLTNKMQDALTDQMKSAMDAASSTPQQRKSKEERIARITRDRSTLDMLTRKFEHPFNHSYVSKLSPILKSRFNKQFEGVKTGEFAKAEFNNASYQAWAELLIEAAGKKAVADGFVEQGAEAPAAPKQGTTSPRAKKTADAEAPAKSTATINVALFSQGLLSPAASGPKPTLDQIQRFVEKLQNISKNVLPVTVVASPSDVPGLEIPVGTKPSGALVGGQIYLFADNLKSTGDAYVTLFHEVFHLGLQKVIPAEDYAALLKQFASSPLVAKYTRQWKASKEGVQKAARMPSAAYEALAAEEALAMIAEEMSANNGVGTRRLPGMVKRMLSWFAQVAEKLGFPATFSNWVRDLTRTDAERFVSDMTRAVLGGPKNLARTQAKYGTMAKEMTAQDRLRSEDDNPQVMPSRSFDSKANTMGVPRLRGFDRFGAGKADVKLAQRQAESLVGHALGFETLVSDELPADTPAAFDRDSGRVLVNPIHLQFLTQGQLTSILVEEYMHGVDSVGSTRVMSVTSERFATGGDIRSEIEANRSSNAAFDNFLKYPLDFSLSQKDKSVELFARLSVLYFNDPTLFKSSFPTTYEAYHAIFGLERDAARGSDSYLRGPSWRERIPGGQGSNADGIYGPAGDRLAQRLDGKPADQRLGQLRYQLAEVFGATKTGGFYGRSLSQNREIPEGAQTANPDIRYRSATAASIASSMGDMTPDQEKAYKNVAGMKAVPTVRERMDALKANLGLKLRQGLVDQFAAIKQLDQNAYVQARMSKGTDGTLEAMLMYGKPFMRDGAPDVDIKDGGFAKVLASLKGEQDRWMMWIAAQRAEKLKAEGKENLMTDDDISALKTLNAGTMADGTARIPVYAKALQELNDYNDAMLKLAMDSGLIDQDAYDLMAGQPYVPFYRLMEDGDMKGPKFSSGLVNQKAWQKLKGGTQQLNADLLQNMLLNWSHLLQASAKNRAATATMDAAEKMAVAYKVDADTKGAVKVMRDGSAEHWMVEDPYLLDAISAIHYVPSPLMKPLAKFKQLLTWGVTVNPTFKIRNLIRDSVSAIAQADLGYNPAGNVAKGWKLTAKDSQIYASMLASGGLIKFGTQENTDRLRAQVAKLGGVVLDKSGAERFFGQIKDLYDVYNEFGDRAENVNRAALYDALIKKGKTHAEAAFMARDLMDFSMGGSAPVVRFLTQAVPFLNARLVGLDKLGRAAIEDPRRFAAVTGAVALASLALMAGYSDDEDWKKREDWDRDAYWWFKIGGQAYRIPKPFEVGAIGTLAERTAELMLSDEMTGKRYMERVSHMLSGTFSFNPVPQAFKPLLDLYANKDSFTGRAIESQADQRLRPQDRYSERTPEVAKFLGGLGLPDPAQLVKGEYSALSPKQVEHLIRGYFSWVGTAAMTVSDFGLRPLAGRGERPDMRLKDVFIAGNFVENLPTGSSRYVTQMYEQSRQIEQAYASYQEAIKAGDMEKAQSIKESAGPLLRNRPAYTAATRQLAEINRTAKRIEADQAMAGAAKRARLTELEQQRQVIAQRVNRLAAATP